MSYETTKFQAFFAEKSAARLCFLENFPMQMNLVVKINLDGWRCGIAVRNEPKSIGEHDGG
jgi:hypothetical protein